MKENRLATIIKKDMLKKEADKTKIDPVFRKEIETIIKEHQSEFDRLK